MAQNPFKSVKFYSIAVVPLLVAVLAATTPSRTIQAADEVAASVAATTVAPLTVAAPAPPAPAAAAVPAPAPPAPPVHYSRKHHERGHRAWLGVTLGDEDGNGVTIRSVLDDSPAQKAGLQRGDKILEIGGVKVEEMDDLLGKMRDLEPDDRIDLVIDRDGQEQTVSVVLGERRGRHRLRIMSWDDDGSFVHLGGSRLVLGVAVQSMSRDLRDYFHAPDDAGVLVNRVFEDSSAAEAGLKAGDVIIGVDGKDIARTGDIRRALRDHEAGDRIPVRIVRDGSEQDLDVTLKEADRRHGYVGPGFIWRPGQDYEVTMDASDFIVDVPDICFDGEYEISDEQQEQIRRSMKEASRALRESMRQLREQLREQRREMRRQKEQIRLELRDIQSLQENRRNERGSAIYDI